MLLCGSCSGIELKPGRKVNPYDIDALGKLRITQVPYAVGLPAFDFNS